MKNLLALLILLAVTGTAWGIQTWLEARSLARFEQLFIGVFGLGLTILLVVLILHFGRFV